jgi:crotonobetainyl-CoA:carnitine CoA-transferase CaiB-like acyl-CoA transferase
MQELSVFTVGGVPQERGAEPNAHVYIRAPYGVFPASEGYLALGFADLTALGEVIGEPSFAGLDPEVAGWTHRDELYAKTAARLATRPASEWVELLLAAGIWAGPVYGYAELVDDPQIQHNGTFVEYEHPTEGHVKTPGFPYRFSATPARIDRGAPLVGEHSREVLTELGLAPERIEALLADGVVAESTVLA